MKTDYGQSLMKLLVFVFAFCLGVIVEMRSPHKPTIFPISNSGRFGSEPAVAYAGHIWCDDKWMDNFDVQDENGQVYELVQCRTNTNLYTVWKDTGKTNGLHHGIPFVVPPEQVSNLLRLVSPIIVRPVITSSFATDQTNIMIYIRRGDCEDDTSIQSVFRGTER